MRKDRLNMYKESYNNELARREKLGSEISIPIAIVTLLFGSVTYAVGKLEAVTGIFILILLIASLMTLVVSLAFAVFYIVRSNYSYVYEYIASSQQMEEYYNKLTDFYKEDITYESKVEEAFEVYLLNDYCKCNEQNTSNNDKRSDYLHKARKAIIVALVASTITIGLCNYDRVITTTQNCINKVTAGKEVNTNGQIDKPTCPKSSATTATTTAAPITPTN